MSNFLGWTKVTKTIKQSIDTNDRLNESQKVSVTNILERINKTGVIIADEVGMGKTRIAVELVHAVKKAGGRVAIVVPTTLGFQWQKELNERENDLAPKHIINSLSRFMHAWDDCNQSEHGDNCNQLEHWDAQSVILLSQNFANWRIGQQSHSSRWALLPEVYAQWKKHQNDRFPNGYNSHEDLKFTGAQCCACRIIKSVSTLPENDPRKNVLNSIVSGFTWKMGSFDRDSFSTGNDYRELLEKAVGLGLGSFDLVVIDEAHKSRGENSSLNRVLNKVLIQNSKGRRLAVTATPVELSVEQWKQMLSRIQLADKTQEPILSSINNYAEAVRKLQQCWKTDEKVRADFKQSAIEFENALKPYLLRRDKRQDPTIEAFYAVSNKPINAYRQRKQVEIEVKKLPDEWKRIVCSVEGLSAASSMQEDSVSKRARLTLANGHGIAGIIDKTVISNEEDESLECDKVSFDSKKTQRSNWWKQQIIQVYENGDESLYQHPAILKIITEIELNLQNNQKALVFGKLTKPMRILVKLLNAREMLRRLNEGKFWPQTTVCVGIKDGDNDSEIHAVEFASKQLELNWSIDEINARLKKQYNKYTYQIDKTKYQLIEDIEQSIDILNIRCKSLFSAFKSSIIGSGSDSNKTLIFITRAIYELSGSDDFKLTSQEVAQGFIDLMEAVTSENEGDTDGDGQLDNKEAETLWPEIEARIKDEFAHVRGGMARLMFGGTSAASRRVLQLGFNRQNSFPKVLVAQSVVGREGLNLHRACRIVYLLHPEWNPGVVEQQIGRIDRLNSRWEQEFNKIKESKINPDELPFIEVKPIVFKGTYDEYNWQVLQTRWDELQSQLHGIVIPESERDGVFSDLYDELCAAAPDFSPKA